MKTLGVLVSAALMLHACGGKANRDQGSEIKEAFNAINDPLRLNPNLSFSYDPSQLPSSGQSARYVWTGHWWPESEGGTNARRGAALSPLEKYDLATGNGGRASAWESQNAYVHGGVSWAGHCDGLAAAGLNEREPRRTTQYGGVIFTPEDVKALLVEKWQNGYGGALVGGRCNITSYRDPFGRMVEPSCRDMNPGSFHILLGNLLGLQGEPFIVDIRSDEQVWNFPVVSYQSSVQEIGRSEAARLVGLGQGSYEFNPYATQFMVARTTIRLATGATQTFEYVLEANNGLITGGEWIGTSQNNHPDFAWTLTTPGLKNPGLFIGNIDAIAEGSF